ncbi:helix-turn-helix domain-containing protein [Changchengzhania lutea]|uniref:helix-turn-helix domain-containing protein n=1 Tax=Changchengzhania lutea TaxID=2049305 RepID=UPI00115ECB19|nr:helix-turn-helix transcriptional regulator [Changchengzhania lutea]
MINNADFSKRLQKVMDYYGESAASFSEKIGVQRSSISHILSGRNKPSLDFILKILSSFPEVELYWLINGKGQFPNEVQSDDNIPSSESKVSEKLNITKHAESKTIERIVIFYSDGTFKNYMD